MALIITGTYVTDAQNSFYHFRTVVTTATFGFLAVAAFLESNTLPSADCIRDELVIVVKVMICFLHA